MNSFSKSRLSSVLGLLAICATPLVFVPPLRSGDLHSRIDQYLKSKTIAKQFSGEVLVARGDDVLILGDYGRSGPKYSMKNNNLFRFPVGAIDEQFVALAVLQLEEQGKIKLAASICDYLSNCPRDWKEIHLVHLLTHTSGLPFLKQDFPDQTNLAQSDTLQRLLAALAEQSLESKPGSEFKYNRLDFIVLGLVIESVSGRPADEYIGTEVFHALKMTDTADKEEISQQGSKDLQGPPLQNRRDGTVPGWTMKDDRTYSTIEDLYRFDRALTSGAIVSQASLLQMFTPFRDGHGLGWKIIKEFDRRAALQRGQSDGVSVSVRLYPDDDVYIILVADGHDIDSAELTHDIGAILFGKGYPASREATPVSPVEK
ncbi:MAG: serine hydrolase domain-containing protein [Candidatus Sulfotelmatobacter sp.]